METGLNQKEYIQYREIIQQKVKTEEQKITKNALIPVDEYIKEYGKQHNYKIIFGATGLGNIIYKDDAIDITDIILEEVNNNYKKNNKNIN